MPPPMIAIVAGYQSLWVRLDDPEGARTLVWAPASTSMPPLTWNQHYRMYDYVEELPLWPAACR